MQLIGTIKAAEILDIHPITLREKAIKNEIPAYRIGKMWKFDLIELENHIKKNKNTPVQEMGRKEDLCHVNSYRSEKEVKYGTTRTRRQMVSGYAEVLGLPIKTKPCS